MGRTKRFAWMTGLYLLGLLLVTLALGYPVSWWLAFVFVCAVSLAIFARLERRRHIHPEDVRRLTRELWWEAWYWRKLERDWIGRPVLLVEDIRNSKEPEGRQVYVKAGTLGKIVRLNRSPSTPFNVRFPGFQYEIAVRLSRTE